MIMSALLTVAMVNSSAEAVFAMITPPATDAISPAI